MPFCPVPISENFVSFDSAASPYWINLPVVSLFKYMPREQERITYLTETSLECMSGRREARISDLSVGGCYIDSIAEVAVGEEILFELRLPSGVSVPVRGRVAYILAGNGFGVSFTSLPDTSRVIIEQMIGGNCA